VDCEEPVVVQVAVDFYLLPSTNEMRNVELCGKKHTGDPNLIIRVNNSVILQDCYSYSVYFSFSFVSFVPFCPIKTGRKFRLFSTLRNCREGNDNDFLQEVAHGAY
jgi:hypothetical protein